MTRETVERETPDKRAISIIVVLPFNLLFLSDSPGGELCRRLCVHPVSSTQGSTEYVNKSKPFSSYMITGGLSKQKDIGNCL